MTSMYIIMKQERDKLLQQQDAVKRDAQNIDKIIKENVDKALNLRKQQFHELTSKVKEAQEKAATLEQAKKCYSNTIKYLESELSTTKEALECEKEKNWLLLEELKGKEIHFDDGPRGVLYDEKIRLKQLKADDELMTHKLKGLYEDDTRIDEAGRGSSVGMAGVEKEFRTTDGADDCSYEEATNCRLREETNASMMFGANPQSAVVRLNQI